MLKAKQKLKEIKENVLGITNNLVLVKCPKCDNTWWTNIPEQRCIRYYRGCSEVVSIVKHGQPDPVLDRV